MVKYIVLGVTMCLVLHLSNAIEPQKQIKKIEYCMAVFDILEKNVGKEVSVGTIQTYYKNQIDLEDSEWERLIRSVDDDYSGSLDKNELCRMAKNINLFIESDLNKDGYVDIGEANLMLSKLAPQMMTDVDKGELIEEVYGCKQSAIDVPDVSYLWKIVNCFTSMISGSNVASYTHLKDSWLKANNYEVGLAGNDFRMLMRVVRNKGDKFISMRQFARILLGRDTFKAIDIYGAFDVTEEELINGKAAFGWMDQFITDRFRNADTNKNGRLNFVEFMVFRFGVEGDILLPHRCL